MTVREWLKQDRQWPRDLRIAHAKLRMEQSRKANDQKGVAFWSAVLEANGVEL